MSAPDLDLAIVGGGPRGLAVLEALAIELNDGARALMRIALIDDVEPGAGRIWRTEQPANLLMNTLASQVTLFSLGCDESGAPGHGPSLYDWLTSGSPAPPDFYASRQAYGRYLKFVLQRTVAWLRQAGAQIEVRTDRVEELESDGAVFTLKLGSGAQLSARTAVLCTGHAAYHHAAVGQPFLGCDRYVAGDSCADMPLDDIPAGSSLGLIGMGLGFHDIVSTLTQGRGGRFRTVMGALQYLPSGQEPIIFAGSRTGLPIPGRAVNQKTGYRHQAVFFSADYLAPLLAGENGQLDFSEHLLPLLVAEMEHTYYSKHIENVHGTAAAKAFELQHLSQRHPWKPFDTSLLAPYALGHIERFDLQRLKAPFDGRTYAVHADFNQACALYLEQDLDSAQAGNLTSPLKAALDVMRDTRDLLRECVEFQGLALHSWHRFTREFASVASLLAAGPPIFRVEQLLALMKAGVVSLIGPGLVTEFDGEHFQLSSPAVLKGVIRTQWLVDARTPFPALLQTANTLLRGLVERELVEPYRDESGGITIEPATFRVKNPRQVTGLFALGIPTEGPKWFTQVGSGTPGKYSNFTREAQQLVSALLTDLQGKAEHEQL